jgi:hypothetical protein
MSVYVGIDVHRKRSQVAVIDQGGEVLANRNVTNGVEPVRLDYWIGLVGLGSSLSDHFGRLPALALPAGLPDGAEPGSDVQGRRAFGAAPRERRAAPPGWPGPLPVSPAGCGLLRCRG